MLILVLKSVKISYREKKNRHVFYDYRFHISFGKVPTAYTCLKKNYILFSQRDFLDHLINMNKIIVCLHNS